MKVRTTLLASLSAVALVGSAAFASSGADARPTDAAAAPSTQQSADAPRGSAGTKDYVVLFKGTQPDRAGRAAIRSAGGTITGISSEIGVAYVHASSASFASRLDHSGSVVGVARDREIGRVPDDRAKKSDLERLARERHSLKSGTTADAPAVKAAAGEAVTPEPLANRQWDMRQIGATAQGSYAKDQGSKKVLVGVIDTGIDGTHPDIAPNFNSALSHNFVSDKPDIDGPCEHPSCVDPADEDDDGHGTHVASTIGSPINGLGIAGVAPDVSLVNIRAGQDSGYFFLESTLKALTYAGDIGVDVVNMSFYTDPWLYNCTDNPADSPAEQSEQRVVRTATQRAVNYATGHNVLPVAALGNEATDLNHPTSDDSSPDYPVGIAHPRTVDNSCLSVPTETKGVMSVSSTGPSTRKAYYSNWGTQEADVAAPGGDAYDTPANTLDPQALVLAAYPESLAKANGDLNPDGTPNTPFVVRDCKGATCAYYQYLQGTSMAAPHAVGVAALAVSRYGKPDPQHGGLKLAPRVTAKAVYGSAQKHACPSPRLFHYTRVTSTSTVESDARCDGSMAKNGFYGHGIVNAFAVLGR